MEQNSEIMVESEVCKLKPQRKKGKKQNRPIWFLSGMIFSICLLSLVAWRFADSTEKEKKVTLTEELQLQRDELNRVVDKELQAEKETQDKYLMMETDPLLEKKSESMADDFLGDILEDEQKAKAEEKGDLLNLSGSGVSQDISLLDQMNQIDPIDSLKSETARPVSSSPQYRREYREEREPRSMFVYSRSYSKAQMFEDRDGQVIPGGNESEVEKTMMRPTGDTFPTVIYNKMKPVKVFEGNWLEGVLLNRLVADIEECPVIVSVSKDFFDDDGRYVVIPSGTRVIGKSKVVDNQGSARLFVWFERMILPNGVSVRFPEGKKSLGLDRQGSTGLVSKINRHFLLRFGNAIMFGILEGLAGLTQRRSNYDNNKAVFIERSGQTFTQINSQMLQERANIMPTITVAQGHRVKVYLSSDLLISPYDFIHNRGYAK